MPLLKKFILRNFSKNAKYYDNAAEIQNYIASELIKKISADIINHILEIGCGTGNYTKKLLTHCLVKKIIAIDISEKMLDIAIKKTADAENTVMYINCAAENMDSHNALKSKFDLITSNSALQWCDNKTAVFSKIYSALNDGGILLFSIFGDETFKELSASINELFKSESFNIPAHFFVNKEQLEELLKSFSDINISELQITRKYNSLLELLKTIKYTGETGAPLNTEKMFTMKTIENLEKIYLTKFGEIKATYHFFIAECKKI